MFDDNNLELGDFQEYQDQPHKLNSGQGLDWVKDAWALFKANIPMWLIALCAYFLVYVFAGSLAGLLNAGSSSILLEVLIAALLQPLSAGIFYCAHLQRFKHDFEIQDFFAGFKRQTVTLMQLGVVLSLLTHSVLLGLSYAITGSIVDTAELMEALKQPDALAQVNSLTWLFITLAYALLIMLSYLSAPLIFFNKLSVFNALSTSFNACMKNIGAFTVFGLIVAALMIASVFTLGLALIVLVPTLMISSYCIYASIFASGKGEDISIDSIKIPQHSAAKSTTLDA